MSQQLASVIEHIASYTGQPRNLLLVSRYWYDSLSENNRNMIEGILRKYPQFKSLYSVYILAIKDNDVNTVKKLAFEYSGYLPFRWSLGTPYINSKEMFDIIWLKSEIIDVNLKKKAYKYATDDIIRGIRTPRDDKRFCIGIPTRDDLFDRNSMICLSIAEIESLVDRYPNFGITEVKRMINAIKVQYVGDPIRADIIDWIISRYGLAPFQDMNTASYETLAELAKHGYHITNPSVLSVINDNPSNADRIPDLNMATLIRSYKPNLYNILHYKVIQYIFNNPNIFNGDIPLLPYVKYDIFYNRDLMKLYFDTKKLNADIGLISEALKLFIDNGFTGSDIMNYINEYELIEALDEHITKDNFIALLISINSFSKRVLRYLSMKNMHPEWFAGLYNSNLSGIPDKFLEIAMTAAVKLHLLKLSLNIAKGLKLSSDRKGRLRKFVRSNFTLSQTESIMMNIK